MAGTSNKIFVGGLQQTVTDDAFQDYFSQYGKITDAIVMKDRETGRSRGFGFVTYEETSSVDEAMDKYKDHKIDDKWVELKRATPQDQMPPGKGGGGKGGGGKGGGGKGGDRGGGGGGRPGDWTCGSCGANVYASKDSCFKCGAGKPTGGGGGGQPPAGYGPAPGGMPYGAYGAPPGYGYSPYGPAPGAYGGFPGYGGMPAYGAYGGMPPASSPLPPGWEQASDPSTGTPYYFNQSTRETTWTRPTPPPLPSGWEQVTDPSTGAPYYCNRSTNATTWTRPTQ